VIVMKAVKFVGYIALAFLLVYRNIYINYERVACVGCKGLDFVL